MPYFRKCEICGANLDPGEKCTCEQERKQEENEKIISKQVNAIMQLLNIGRGKNGSTKRTRKRT